MNERLEQIRERLKGITQGEWSVPHLSDDSTTCNCSYVLNEGYCGYICEVGVDNGKKIADGGNDCPPLEEAKRNGIFIAHAKEDIEFLLEEVSRLRKEFVKASNRASHEWTKAPAFSTFVDLKHGPFGKLLDIYENDEISRGKLCEVMAQLAHGMKLEDIPLPPINEYAPNDDTSERQPSIQHNVGPANQRTCSHAGVMGKEDCIHCSSEAFHAFYYRPLKDNGDAL